MSQSKNIRIQSRADTKENWESVELNPTLLPREIGYELDTGAYKIGDGNTPWNDLPYFSVGQKTEGQGEVFNGTENEAISKLSHAEGQTTFAGGRGYYIIEKLADKTGYKLSNTAGLEVGDVYTAFDKNNAGQITEILADNIVKVDNFVDSQMYDLNDPQNYFVNIFRVLAKPEVGDIDFGFGAHAEGRGTQALGDASHAEGHSNIAGGRYSHVEGKDNLAQYCSHAEGHTNQSLGYYSHTEGWQNQAIGNGSHAEGKKTIAKSTYSHAEGEETLGSGKWSHAEGYKTEAKGDGSHTEGNYTFAKGKYSHAEGGLSPDAEMFLQQEGELYNTTAFGKASHAEGGTTHATGDYSHAEGVETDGNGWASHAEGYWTFAAKCAHAEGSDTQANGEASHTEGYATQTNGFCAHAEGTWTQANGTASHAEGCETIANGKSQHVEGKYNIEDNENKYIHIAGNGTDYEKRSNAYTLDWEGNGDYAGEVITNDVRLKNQVSEITISGQYILDEENKTLKDITPKTLFIDNVTGPNLKNYGSLAATQNHSDKLIFNANGWVTKKTKIKKITINPSQAKSWRQASNTDKTQLIKRFFINIHSSTFLTPEEMDLFNNNKAVFIIYDGLSSHYTFNSSSSQKWELLEKEGSYIRIQIHDPNAVDIANGVGASTKDIITENIPDGMYDFRNNNLTFFLVLANEEITQYSHQTTPIQDVNKYFTTNSVLQYSDEYNNKYICNDLKYRSLNSYLETIEEKFYDIFINERQYGGQ